MREPYRPVIEVGPGWHALLLALDARLAQVAPDYLIGQITDRFGYLRFYIDLPELTPDCCRAARQVADTSEHPDQFLRTHSDTDEHARGWAALAGARAHQREIREQLEQLVWQACQDAARTCSQCGAPGVVHTRDYDTRVLCSSCAGYAVRDSLA